MIAPLIKGLVLGLILSISVGPIIFAIIKHSINSGRKAGLSFVAGVSTSDISLVLFCNFFTGLFATALEHKNKIALAGSVFLIALGVYTLFFKKVSISENANGVAEKLTWQKYLGLYLSGFFMNTLNPGVFLFWFAWTAAIVADAAVASNPANYKAVVFITCLAFVLASDIVKVVLSEKLRPKLNAKNLHIINQVAGAILIGFGVFLLYGAIQ
ncbi:MAG: LysE family transporter [Bacteroidetes bacterium]|jgi:threonine/homoserine/homoserine lactone efflux protein|nr:LysE family transporter [Bacteroidota bacterium]